MNIYKACITSSKHACANKPCQDFCAIMPTYDNYITAALSDGAGSARFADLAAFTNVNAFFNYMRKYTEKYSLNDLVRLDNKEIGEDVVMYCRQAIVNLSGRMFLTDSDLRDFCATFIGVVVSDKEFLILHLGDGEVFGLTKNNEIKCISTADNIMGFRNQTHFTVDDDAVDFMRVSRFPIESFKAILLMSDGVKPTSDNPEQHIASHIFSEWQKGHLTDNKDLYVFIDNEITRIHNDDYSAIFLEF